MLRRTFSATEIEEVKRGLGQRKYLAYSPQAVLPEILRLRQQGKSLSEIGRLLGFTHQAIGRARRLQGRVRLDRGEHLSRRLPDGSHPLEPGGLVCDAAPPPT
jgi:hypothetical protein